MPTPIPSWDGVSYVDSVALPTARSGDGIGEFGPELDPMAVWVDGVIVEELDDIRDIPIGDALNLSPNERGIANIPLTPGINIDHNGNRRQVFFVLHDVSDEALAEKLGIAWAGALQKTPDAATSPATYVNGRWTMYGDLPNPITRRIDGNPPGLPPQDPTNDYSPLRKVVIDGKEVIVNAFYVQWGDEEWEHLRIDQTCTSFPDDPPNTGCMYNGQRWGGDGSGHVVEIVTTGPNPYVRMKLHKSWSGEGDYLPYYVVADSFPAGPANNMGVIYVPKHAHLGAAAVPLIQFLPPERLNATYPPTPADGRGFAGGGPLGGQIGIPSYFMPEDDYSPMWHIGFAHWLEPATEVVKGLEQVKKLRAEGKLQIHDLPPTNVGTDNYDFNDLNSIHVVNCPTPMTLDARIHDARRLLSTALPAGIAAGDDDWDDDDGDDGEDVAFAFGQGDDGDDDDDD